MNDLIQKQDTTLVLPLDLSILRDAKQRAVWLELLCSKQYSNAVQAAAFIGANLSGDNRDLLSYQILDFGYNDDSSDDGFDTLQASEFWEAIKKRAIFKRIDDEFFNWRDYLKLGKNPTIEQLETLSPEEQDYEFPHFWRFCSRLESEGLGKAKTLAGYINTIWEHYDQNELGKEFRIRLEIQKGIWMYVYLKPDSYSQSWFGFESFKLVLGDLFLLE